MTLQCSNILYNVRQAKQTAYVSLNERGRNDVRKNAFVSQVSLELTPYFLCSLARVLHSRIFSVRNSGASLI